MELIINYIVGRMKERSTWLGLVGVLASFGIAIEPAMAEAIAGVGIAAASVLMIVFKDISDKKAPKVEDKSGE